ncbi:hypothetical protein EBB79_01225 [Parasedimentitalea marina]|uniref:Tetratricopeptide repeat protein n=1 Tax=Parasedimentitalea marina TaxID=2483033 RepID=A0A3T0MY24_9RHOB|nr:hypothetical protein EBB79_01225 [Parasedimentitalea marina]
MPVCDRESFPIYREFSKDEVKRLKDIVKTGWYQAATSQSRYLRAYLVEREFGTYSEEDMFWLLQSGHFYDAKNTFGNEEFYSEFRTAANAYVKVAKPEDQKLVLLLAAFARVHFGDPSKALKMLGSAARIPTPDTPFFDQYAKLVRACVGKPDVDKCDPNYLVTID